jgi:phthiocerol/phenolphthiocerol synthesis type-I polyketide synthase D
MAAHLRANQSVYGLRPVNLDVADVNLSAERLAASHLQKILTVQARGPYQLIGYSFGGLVAFEMATLLANRGEDVGFLGLVDTLHPLFLRDLSPAEMLRFRKTFLGDRIKKYARNLFQGRIQSVSADASRFIGKKVRPIAWKITKRLYQALNRPLPSRAPALVNEEMWRSYTPKEYPGHLVLFRVEKAMDGGKEFDDDLSLGWRKYAKNGVDIQFVQGGHGTVMQMPYVLSLVSKLAPYLTDIERD